MSGGAPYVEWARPTAGAALRWGGLLVVAVAVAVTIDPVLAAVIPLGWLALFITTEGPTGAVRVEQGRVRWGVIQIPAHDVVDVTEPRNGAVRQARRSFGGVNALWRCPSWMPAALVLELRSVEGIAGRALLGTRHPEALRAALGRASHAPPQPQSAVDGDEVDARAGVGATPGTWVLAGFCALAAVASANSGGLDVALAFAVGLPALVTLNALRRVRVDGQGLRFGRISVATERIRSVRAVAHGEAGYLVKSLPAVTGRHRMPPWPPPRALIVTTHPDDGRTFEQLDRSEQGRHVYVLACRPADRAAAALTARITAKPTSPR